MEFSNLNRPAFVEQLGSTQFDLLVIGGGITGCGIALDAALRGLKVALIEKNDFASGTSSRSTKLIHGGLRYLKQMEFGLVYEVGRERAIVHRNARNLVLPEKMLLPITKGGSLGMTSASFGLLFYDLLAGVKKDERRQMLDKHETLRVEPLLDGSKLIGGGLYVEYRTDDARLVIELAKSAFDNDALLLNYAECKSFIYSNEKKLAGAVVVDKTTGASFNIHAKTVVNACGPWVDLLRKEDDSLKGKRLLLTKGVHIVFPHQKLPVKNSVYFDAGDGRMVFVIPRNNITYAGTTDTVYNQDIDKPQCNREDAEYLLKAVNRMFPIVHLGMQDVESSWAGLRPLIFEQGKSASEISRKDEMIVSPSGLISMAGGKLTGYRLMAEKIVNLVAKRSGKKTEKCRTRDFRISGANFESNEQVKNYLYQLKRSNAVLNIPEIKIDEWVHRYGRNTDKIIEYIQMMDKDFTDKENLFDTAELAYGMQHEMIYSPADFFIRRTGKIFFDRKQAEKRIDYIADIVTKRLKLEDAVKEQMVNLLHSEFFSAVSFSYF